MKATPTRQYQYVLILLIFMFSGCGSNQRSTKPELTQNVEHLISKGNSYWDQRSSPANVPLAISFLENAIGLQEENYDLYVLLSRACHFQGEYHETESTNKDSLFKQGMNAAYNALIESLGTLNADPKGAEPEDILDILSNISFEQTEALYWWAVNFGKLMIKKPVLDRLKYQEVFETVLFKLTSLNPNYYYGGPYRILGVFYARIPGLDLDLSKSNFELSTQIFPKYFATKVLMAEFYYVKIGDRERFHTILEDVVNDDPTLLPEVMAENLNEQKKAKILLEMESSLFE